MRYVQSAEVTTPARDGLRRQRPMSYGLDYQPAAKADLADAWLHAADRRAVTRASYLIDQLLATVPDQVGIPHGVFRRLQISPLEVTYCVDPQAQEVRVFRVDLLP